MPTWATPSGPSIGAPVKPVIEDDDAEFAAFGNAGPVLYLRTDRAAPNRKVIAVDLAQPAQANWKTIVPEGKQAIESVSLIGGRIVAQYLVDVQSRVSLFGLDGSAQGDMPLPGTGTVAGIEGREDTPEIFYAFSSPLFPETVFAYDPQSRQQTPFEAAKPPVDVTQYETKALFATSKDGTRVPFFLTWKKGLALDGSHPAMVYGYGGFSISTLPDLQAGRAGLARTGRHLGDRQHARRRGVRRGVAQGGKSRQEAERVRRLHRRGRAAGQREVHVAGKAGNHGRARTAACWWAR